MLSRAQYFADDTVVDQSKLRRDFNFAKTFSGKYEFDLGDMSHPSIGTVHVKGEFPRLKPRFERPLIKEDEIEEKAAGLTKWVEKYFDTTTNVTYFKELVYTACVYSLYLDPIHDTNSTEMKIFTRTILWLWHLDDIFEMAAVEKISPSKIDNALDQLLNVFNEHIIPYEDIEGFFGIKALYDYLVDLRQNLIQHNITMDELSEFRKLLSIYFGSLRWSSVETLNSNYYENYSEETYKYWRRISSFLDGCSILVLRLLGTNLSEKILTSPSLRKLLDILNSIGAFVNDIFGLKKDLQFGEQENLVLFKVSHKRITLPQAVAEVCVLLKDELTDFMLLRDSILMEFQNDPSLVKYIDVIEGFLDGNNRFYIQSHRHGTAGRVKLSP